MIRRIAKIAAVSLCLASPLYAQTNLTANRTLVAGGVSLTSFTVTTAGIFDMWTTPQTFPAGSTPFDPQMYLFSGIGTGGTNLASDDDGCASFLAQCGPSASSSNSIINDFALGVGDYTLAVGAFSFTQAEAVTGVNPGNIGAGLYAVRIASNSTFNPPGVAYGTATLIGADTVVPEPSTIALLASGLLGVGGIARRRRAS